MSAAEAIATPWRRASLAAALFALDPLSSGLLIRAAPGPARDALLERLAQELAPLRLIRVPAQIADDRLIGGLDVAATLRAGKPVAEKGVMASARRRRARGRDGGTGFGFDGGAAWRGAR